MRKVEHRIRYRVGLGYEILADSGWLFIGDLEKREPEGRVLDWDMLFVWRAYNQRIFGSEGPAVRQPEGVLVRVTVEVEPSA